MKKTGMKRVLLLGSGYVSGPVVEYLTRDERTQVTVGEFLQTSIGMTSVPLNVLHQLWCSVHRWNRTNVHTASGRRGHIHSL